MYVYYNIYMHIYICSYHLHLAYITLIYMLNIQIFFYGRCTHSISTILLLRWHYHLHRRSTTDTCQIFIISKTFYLGFNLPAFNTNIIGIETSRGGGWFTVHPESYSLHIQVIGCQIKL